MNQSITQSLNVFIYKISSQFKTKVKKNNNDASKRVKHESFYLLGEKSYEMKIMEESYKGEINRLQKRLQWYAENQELLDKDAARLRGAKEEIDKLKVEVIIVSNFTRTKPMQSKRHQVPDLLIAPLDRVSYSLKCMYWGWGWGVGNLLPDFLVGSSNGHTLLLIISI